MAKLIASKWVQKHLIPINIDGQERHLGWLKRTYREWFRYAQLTQHPPKAFGDILSYGTSDKFALRNVHKRHERDNILVNPPDREFERWWKDYRKLFIEPVSTPVQVFTKPPAVIDTADSLYLKVDLTDTDAAIFETKRILENHRRKYEFKSNAPLSPSLPQRSVMLEKIFAYRLTWVLKHQKGYTRSQISDYLMEEELIIDKGKEDNNRKVSLYVSKARGILRNIEKGSFP